MPLSRIDPAAHVDLVHQISRRYEIKRGLAAGETLGDAWLAMVEACRTFDPARGMAFTTFARTKIHRGIIDAYRAHTRIRTVKDADGKYSKVARRTGRIHHGLAGRKADPARGLIEREAIELERARWRARADRGWKATHERRSEVAELVWRGIPQRTIARALGVDELVVCNDVGVLRTGLIRQ